MLAPTLLKGVNTEEEQMADEVAQKLATMRVAEAEAGAAGPAANGTGGGGGGGGAAEGQASLTETQVRACVRVKRMVRSLRLITLCIGGMIFRACLVRASSRAAPQRSTDFRTHKSHNRPTTTSWRR